MSDIIWKLRDDHGKLARLLDLMAREVRRFDAGERPDYELVETILEYILNYPDLYHHPLEDLVLGRLARRNPDAARDIGDLASEHRVLGSLTRRFAAALRNVTQDDQLPRDWFVDIANEYLSAQRRHIQMEEVVFFPAALRALTAEDWADLRVAAQTLDDPLFGGGPTGRYARLHREIMKWSRPETGPGAG